MLKLGITGASGRMGKNLVEVITSAPDLKLTAALLRPGSDLAGVDAGRLAMGAEIGVVTSSDPLALPGQVDVLIDFSSPEASLNCLDVCCETGIPMVIGTTGYDAAQLKRIEGAARKIPICLAANFSTGVNLCLQLLHTAATVLGQNVDIEIVEAHHRHKVDAPSGTALAMGREIAQALGGEPEQLFRFVRQGITGPREAGTIGFAVIRAGDIVGEHQVIFATEGERIEITHKASSRQAFARGAVRAARWLRDQQPGLYDMRDVLGLSSSD